MIESYSDMADTEGYSENTVDSVRIGGKIRAEISH